MSDRILYLRGDDIDTDTFTMSIDFQTDPLGPAPHLCAALYHHYQQMQFTVLRSQNAVFGYLYSKQILSFGFVRQYIYRKETSQQTQTSLNAGFISMHSPSIKPTLGQCLGFATTNFFSPSVNTRAFSFPRIMLLVQALRRHKCGDLVRTAGR